MQVKDLTTDELKTFVYDCAMEMKSIEHSSWYRRGNTLIKLGKFEEAVTSYDLAIEINPDDFAAWYKRGIALNNQGKLEEAIASYDHA
ncbi:MAG: tetratricopeptide repeat protein, partial [Waterburya sp.]